MRHALPSLRDTTWKRAYDVRGGPAAGVATTSSTPRSDA
jgi:hypothetical protein